MWQPYVVPRRRVLFAVWLTALALPFLVIDNLPLAEARAAPMQAISADAIDIGTTSGATTTAVPTPTQTGGASWYAYKPGQCAHLTIPKGTVVTITRLATGVSTTCVVTDRGPHVAGRVIDLDRGTFAQLAGPSLGVIPVRITW